MSTIKGELVLGSVLVMVLTRMDCVRLMNHLDLICVSCYNKQKEEKKTLMWSSIGLRVLPSHFDRVPHDNILLIETQRMASH